MQSLSYSYYNVWFKKQDMDTYTWKGHTKCMFWLNIKWPTIKTDKSHYHRMNFWDTRNQAFNAKFNCNYNFIIKILAVKNFKLLLGHGVVIWGNQ